MTTMEQKSHLLNIYRQHPCRTLPNAWWKTGQKLADMEVQIEEDDQGQLRALRLWEDQRVLAFWRREPADFAPLPPNLTQAHMIFGARRRTELPGWNSLFTPRGLFPSCA